jgi:SSS family solute:Na+ symporter
MQLLDWVMVGTFLLLVLSIAVYTQRYMRSVSDFLSGGRVAGRYLLAISKAEIGAGAVVFVASFEVLAKAGFTLTWWGWMTAPIGLITAITGFVIYRYRETRAMTLAQFFEIRYNKPFRIFTGVLGFAAGLVNFGIIPAVGARFMVFFFGMPPSVRIFSLQVPTYIPLMGVLLTVTLFVAMAGGIITLMVTNCVEAMISQLLYVVLIIGLMLMFRWSQISHILGDRPAGHSLLNPFNSLALRDFNVWYVLMSAFVGVYGTMAWQNQSAYNSVALTAHESRMGSILSSWLGLVKGPVIVLLAVCAMTFLDHPDFRAKSAAARAEIAAISQPQVREQMRLPVAVVHILPTGLKGAFCAILLMGVFGGDGTHLHSWGSLFIQDVLVPLRKEPLTPRQHIRWLRLSMSGVALFAFFFGALFRQTEYIQMWWAVTMAIYVGGAGSVIIGGLYWSKGTSAGAWTALIAGSTLATGGILIRQVYGERFPLNGTQISFFSTLTAIALYVAVSYLTCRQEFNMNRMLHRGRYALATEGAPVAKPKFSWSDAIGISENFSPFDKLITVVLFVWSMSWFGVFALGTVWNLISPWPASVWSTFWYLVGIWIPMLWALVGTGWFIWGGVTNIGELFVRLRQEKPNALDNGMVVNHRNLDEAAQITLAAPDGEEKSVPTPVAR